MDKYYQEFEDTEENKLTYTPIFNEYVSGFRFSPQRLGVL